MSVPVDPQTPLREFRKTQEFFVGIDSDGCAFDTMEVKHKECFIPNIIKVFGLAAVSKYAREAAEFINLYSTWRGINRFPGLTMSLDLLAERPEVQRRGFRVPELVGLRRWIDRETKLANPTLKAEVAATGDPDGVGPWAGVWLAIAVCAAMAAIIGFLAFRLRISGVHLSLLTIAFAELVRIAFDHIDWLGGPGGLFLRVAERDRIDLRRVSRSACDVLLRDTRARGRRPRCSARSCCAGAPATTGAPSARTRSPRGRSASTPFGGRCAPSCSAPR